MFIICNAPGRPFTGAWIETACCSRLDILGYWSPLHGGVDRNWLLSLWRAETKRRPFTGAWIETVSRVKETTGWQVAPSRGRGSKPLEGAASVAFRKSPLHGGVDRNTLSVGGALLGSRSPLHGGVDRNLKLTQKLIAIIGRPFTGAWIET